MAIAGDPPVVRSGLRGLLSHADRDMAEAGEGAVVRADPTPRREPRASVGYRRGEGTRWEGGHDGNSGSLRPR